MPLQDLSTWSIIFLILQWTSKLELILLKCILSASYNYAATALLGDVFVKTFYICLPSECTATLPVKLHLFIIC